MEIRFKTRQQVFLANLLMETDDIYEVDEIISNYGHDALVVYHMLMAHHLDEHYNTDLAKQALSKFLN